MGSRTGRTVITRRGALEKVRKNLDRLSTRQAQLIRMRHGIEEQPGSPVGDPPEGCSRETVRRVRAIEEQVLDQVREKRHYSRPESSKQKIIKALKKKT